MSMVRAEKVTKVYRKGGVEIRPLDGVDLEVEPGEFVCLMGPSGSGKTTLLNLVAGIDRPTSGRVFVGEDEVSAMSETALAGWRTRSIGYIFQLYNLIPVLTARENVELPLLLLPMSRKARKKHVETALSAVSLLDRAAHYPRQLSGGQEQRVAIARAIVTDPKVIVADEPTGDLDAASGEEILDLLAALRREFGKTLLMVTHSPRAAEHAGRVVHLDKGLIRPAAEPAAAGKGQT
ncbi:MAG: ABC transporter ATP-binding protein [Planctomycetes bacterium]|jgi:putative ABC transport system ATP-binding protein|nr:ABC transporter ATP-binding protein [Planctomycetota bacterium]